MPRINSPKALPLYLFADTGPLKGFVTTFLNPVVSKDLPNLPGWVGHNYVGTIKGNNPIALIMLKDTLFRLGSLSPLSLLKLKLGPVTVRSGILPVSYPTFKDAITNLSSQDVDMFLDLSYKGVDRPLSTLGINIGGQPYILGRQGQNTDLLLETWAHESLGHGTENILAEVYPNIKNLYTLLGNLVTNPVLKNSKNWNEVRATFKELLLRGYLETLKDMNLKISDLKNPQIMDKVRARFTDKIRNMSDFQLEDMLSKNHTYGVDYARALKRGPLAKKLIINGLLRFPMIVGGASSIGTLLYDYLDDLALDLQSSPSMKCGGEIKKRIKNGRSKRNYLHGISSKRN